jgi:membrane-bound lytic murein transglycosylase D
VKELGIYKKSPEDEQLILRVARAFGECDANAPKGFVDEVRRYILIWKKTDRLKTALNRGKQKGYSRFISRVLHNYDLPPQYLFLALQESNFDERAVGPQTNYGFAKGMWQFISLTANQYGLQIGPLHNQGVYDPLDERFDYIKSSMAAIKYIKELSASDAQASGLLVMASYNWGQNNVRKIIQKMPENPRERNFWRLLAYKDIPRETYDYVFSIVSAAVICEDPRLFGFDGLDCPTQQNREGTAK